MQELIKYCQTDRQREVIQAIVEHGGQRKFTDDIINQ